MSAKKWIKRILGLMVLTGFVSGLVFAFLPKPIPVDFETVTRGALQVAIEEDGRTRIRDRYIVSAPLSGKLDRIRLKPGARVKPGDVVAVIVPSDPALLDPRSLAQAEARVKAARSAIERATSALAAAQAGLDHSEKEYARAVDLFKKKLLSTTEFDSREMQQRMRVEEYRAARHSKEIAEYELELAEAALIHSRPTTKPPSADELLFELRAPPAALPGGEFQVLRVNQESETVVSAGQGLLELGDPTDLEVEVDVLSADAVKIRTGSRVLMEQWGGESALEGRVRLIEPSGFLKISALGVEEQRVNVIIDFANREQIPGNLGDQFRVEARILVWEGTNIVQVPMSAIFRHDGGFAVFRVRNGFANRIPIQIGHRNGLHAEVVEGLAEGDTVIVHPSDLVIDGVQVVSRI